MAPQHRPSAAAPRRPRRARLGPGLAALFGLALLAAPARPQTGDGSPIVTTQPQMRIPFTPSPGGQVKLVHLFVSSDGGANWAFHAAAQPNERSFRVFEAPADGQYWFAVRTIDFQDRATPPLNSQLVPGLKVVLKRTKPLVTVRPAPPREPGQAGVEWEVRDDYLDLNRFALEYRVPGTDWIPQPTDAKPRGVQYWELKSVTRMEVRLRVADRAGNEADATTVIGPDAGSAAPFGGGSSPAPSAGGGGVPRIHYSNRRQIAIPYKLNDVGVSRISVFELWYTTDKGLTWRKAPKQPDPSQTEGRAEFEAERDGLYGFTFVVKSGVGIGDEPPKPGDPPKKWIEVDTAPPAVSIEVRRGNGAEIRNVAIAWQAKDPNLGEKPVTLQYSESKDGPWLPVPGTGDFERSGSFVWVVAGPPFQFWVRAKAVDKAGNEGADVSKEQITVDLSRPRVDILDPEPGRP
jgi:hypothetical protein